MGGTKRWGISKMKMPVKKKKGFTAELEIRPSCDGKGVEKGK